MADDAAGCTNLKRLLPFAKKAFDMYQKHQAKKAGDGGDGGTRGGDGLMGMVGGLAGAAGVAPPKWMSTNIGGIGTDADKQLRKNAAASEEAFVGAGTAPGLEVWRVEALKPVRQPPFPAHASFYAGDSYILLHTRRKADNPAALEWDLFFLLGGESSQDEKGAAAIFVVNLDDLLNTKPVQHREVQGSESDLFLNLFGGSIVYLDGGVASGFKSATPEAYAPRLLRVKGANADTVRVSQVPMAAASLNAGDVFLLDAGAELVLYCGSASNPLEQRRGAEVLAALKDERKATGVRLDGEAELADCAPFWAAVSGGVAAPVAPALTDEVDAAAAAAAAAAAGPPKLFQLSDESGSVVITQAAEGSPLLPAAAVTPADVWVVTRGGELYVAVGAAASTAERLFVVNRVEAIAEAVGLPAGARVTFFSKDADRGLWNSFFA